MSKKKTPETLADSDLDNVQGGVGLLLPAVQQVREAARTTTDSKFIGETEKNLSIDPDEQDTARFSSTAGGSPNV